MSLRLEKVNVKDVKLGSETSYKNGVVTVNKDELIEELKQDDRIGSIEIEVVKPGESVRIIPVKDVIEPRIKVEGEGELFPGLLGKVSTVGSGTTKTFNGMSVVTTGKLVGFQEGIIDMDGPGADYSPFSKTLNLVVNCEPVKGLKSHEHEEALRLAGLKAARYIAEACQDAQADEQEDYEALPVEEMKSKYPNLPKVGYVYMLQSQGLLHDTWVYGIDAKEIIPTCIYPTEVLDGAIVSGNCVSACDKNTTYHHLNNPIIKDLYARHGKDINFCGVILTNENVTLAAKERSSGYTAKLAEMLGLDGVIVSQEGFGNPDTDLIMNCVKIEDKGIKTVLVTDEYAGRDGASQSLADADPKADAVVTAGNANETIVLPPMDKVVGILETADSIAGGFEGSLRHDKSIEVELQTITGATNQLGFNKLGAIEA
ncbi:glycine/sarcosine/betaine reductase component B subunit [Natranaerobius thermophilus]|uniref:Sarcosine reductase n=1 Tax=Natranaerobius thermophilus (strain ATCC BAA-1301 / DSM 18059 / JW/NM-WN-LF) TaxID=457570 RepID=B2A5X5_NATTJ|nr:glycine/sarcosine/betaine reductase component B subunit [Natranaerobius thermophilus]ACB84068.1 Sarcosine reductase [Natranaerobius thermophilus JW/NM-WN-LF]